MSIGEAASQSGVPPKTIRYYEEIGLITPAERLENRYRAYDDNDVQTLRFIQRARSLGFSLKEVAALLSLYRDRRRASRDVKRLALAHVAELDRKIAEMKAIRNTIADLAARCHGDQRPECQILEELETPEPLRDGICRS
ncbi:MAG: Cu(I)-responsive transcriptional regulator [Bradyrhizobium sp.]|nr:Cu(I)-responsive transcriptional regulator [Pseudomonadota bacterium]MDE2069238.1 Cu(I)-responsive transcriptional regulator [Bradyrhizobium sp.]